jgi:ketosteroid isomerase-like protein
VSARLDQLREAFEAINRGDFEAAGVRMAPDVELRPPSAPEQPIRGREAVVEWLRPDYFDRQRWEVRDLRENGDAVLVELDFIGRGRGSGIELRQPAWAVYEYEGELAHRITTFPDRASALEAVGLTD